MSRRDSVRLEFNEMIHMVSTGKDESKREL